MNRILALGIGFTAAALSWRAGAVSLERVTDGLNQPVYVTPAPGDAGALYVVEQKGRIVRLDKASGETSVFLDIRRQIVSGGEAGLLSVAFHPGYATNGRYFIAYTARRPEFAVHLVERARGGNTEKELLRIEKPYTNHNGGLALFGPDGYLYLSTGDGGGAGDPLRAGQDKSTLLAKILRIDVDRGEPYAIPADNPFAPGEGRRETYAYGLRNVWRFSFDRASGALFAADVGQNELEEINVIEKGGNYGWSTMEGSRCFRPAEGCDSTGLIKPIWEYPRQQGISVTGGYVYRGSRLPALNGTYLYADYGSGRIWGLQYDTASRRVVRNELLLASGLPVSSFGEDEDGEILVVNYQGEVLRLAP